MSLPRPFLPLAALLLPLLAACASVPVQTDFDENTEFLFYTSFAVVPEPGETRAVESLTDVRLRRGIIAGLEAKGLAEAPRTQADLLVRWRTHFRTRVIVSEPWGSPFWYHHRREIYRFREGVFTIEMIDRKKNQVVWTGSATGVVDDPERNRETVQRAVKAILAKYPPMHG